MKAKARHAKEGRSDRWVRIDERVHRSAAWRSLSGPSMRLWIDLRATLNGFNNGKVVASRSVPRGLGWTSDGVRVRALKELADRGFIAYTRKCGPNTFHRAAWFRFTDIPCRADEANGIAGCGPTDEYLRWQEPPPTPRFASSVARTATPQNGSVARTTEGENGSVTRTTEKSPNQVQVIAPKWKRGRAPKPLPSSVPRTYL